MIRAPQTMIEYHINRVWVRTIGVWHHMSQFFFLLIFGYFGGKMHYKGWIISFAPPPQKRAKIWEKKIKKSQVKKKKNFSKKKNFFFFFLVFLDFKLVFGGVKIFSHMGMGGAICLWKKRFFCVFSKKKPKNTFWKGIFSFFTSYHRSSAPQGRDPQKKLVQTPNKQKNKKKIFFSIFFFFFFDFEKFFDFGQNH